MQGSITEKCMKFLKRKLERVNEKLKALDKKKLLKNAVACIAVIGMATVSANLTASNAADIDGKEEITKMLNGVVDVISLIFSAIGIVLFIYNLGTLVMAFKNEDGDSKSRASSNLIVAVFLIAIGVVLDMVGINDLIDRLGK